MNQYKKYKKENNNQIMMMKIKIFNNYINTIKINKNSYRY